MEPALDLQQMHGRKPFFSTSVDDVQRYVDGLDTWQPSDPLVYRERAQQT
jgi:hypothetical protein